MVEVNKCALDASTYRWRAWDRMRDHSRRRAACCRRRLILHLRRVVTCPVWPPILHGMTRILRHLLLWWIRRVAVRWRVGWARLRYRRIYGHISVRFHVVRWLVAVGLVAIRHCKRRTGSLRHAWVPALGAALVAILLTVCVRPLDVFRERPRARRLRETVVRIWRR